MIECRRGSLSESPFHDEEGRPLSLTAQPTSLRLPSRSSSGRSTMGRLRMRSGSCPRQQMRLAEPLRSMGRALPALLPIIVAFILLPAIAFASPPDPSWIAGIYDGADGDDIVSLVYETAAAHAAERLHIGPLPWLADIPLENIVRGICDGRFTRGPRAPPLRSSAVHAHVFSFLPHCASAASGTDPPVTRIAHHAALVPLGRTFSFFPGRTQTGGS